MSLRLLCDCDSWEAMRERIETIPTQDAIEEMHAKNEEGRTAFATAMVGGATVELLESMVELGKQDTKKRKIATVCETDGCPSLALAAEYRTDTATIKLLPRENPLCPRYRPQGQHEELRCRVPAAQVPRSLGVRRHLRPHRPLWRVRPPAMEQGVREEATLSSTPVTLPFSSL